MEGGSSYDSLPHDIILHIFSYIFSRLPLDCVFRLKCVCKAWSALISDFEALHLKRLRETSRGIVCLHTHRDSPDSGDCKISFEIRSLQVGGRFKTLLKKEVFRSNMYSRYWSIGQVHSLGGLICLNDGQDFDVFNPTTGEFASLPPCPRDAFPAFPDSRRSVILSGFGYCPLTKQYKVLSIFHYVYGDVFNQTPLSGFKAAIITVGRSNSSWRIIDIPSSYPFSNNITFCINGTFYWLNYSKNQNQYQYHHITAFNVSDETFQEIGLPPQVDMRPSKTLDLAEHEEGRLCLVDFVEHNGEHLDIYIMLENLQWEFRFRVFFEDFQQYEYDASDSYPECVPMYGNLSYSGMIGGIFVPEEANAIKKIPLSLVVVEDSLLAYGARWEIHM
ncbi:putative F-box protein At1g26515 [Quercus lobata]|uniref:putative F-box protein At1g26515 n=1 Tax=Quercus lobata TaxID=97700 RepID=UPI001244F4D5|nr:putative F-box protein At1g26515 [Quercus lobata]